MNTDLEVKWIYKPKLYLETTVFNYYFLKDVKREQDRLDTVELFNEIKQGYFDAFYSEVVLIEIDKCPQPKKSQMMKLIEKYSIKPVKYYEKYEELAGLYIKEGIISPQKRNDALHIAIATVNNLDSLVSWNCAHIVRFKTRSFVNVINEANRFKRIDINTPKEVIENV